MAGPRNRATPTDNRAQMMANPNSTRPEPNLEALEASCVPTIPSDGGMATEFVPPPPESTEQAPTQDQSAQVAQTAEPATPQAPENPSEGPRWSNDQRFKGKTADDIYDALVAREQTIGRMGDEVGTYRKLFDKFVLEGKTPAQADKAAQATGAQPSDDDAQLLNEMLTAPKKFMERMEERAEQRVLQRFNHAAHLTAYQNTFEQHKATVENPKFQQWLVQTIPHSMAAVADRDPNALNAIVNLFNSTNGQPAPAQVQAQAAPAADPHVRRVPVGSAIGLRATGGAPKSNTVTFTRYELAKMADERPEEYAARNDEILQAYREGRVK